MNYVNRIRIFVHNLIDNMRRNGDRFLVNQKQTSTTLLYLQVQYLTLAAQYSGPMLLAFHSMHPSTIIVPILIV